VFLARHCKALYWHILTGRWGCILKMGLHEKIWKACQECFAQHYTLLHETCDNVQKTCFSSFASSCSQQPSQVLSFWSSHSVGVGTPGLKSKAELCCWHMLTSRFPLRKQKFLLHTVSCEPTWGPTWICLQEVLAARPSCRSLAAWLPSALTQGLAETNSAWQLLWDIVRHCEAMWSYVKLREAVMSSELNVRCCICVLLDATALQAWAEADGDTGDLRGRPCLMTLMVAVFPKLSS